MRGNIYKCGATFINVGDIYKCGATFISVGDIYKCGAFISVGRHL